MSKLRKCSTTSLFLLAVFSATSAFVRAENYIYPPANVDYIAKQTVPYPTPWTIVHDPFHYGIPEWYNPFTLFIPNHPIETQVKDVWFEITYKPNEVPASQPTLTFEEGQNFVADPRTVGQQISDRTFGWHWVLTPQPASETLTVSNPQMPAMVGIEQLTVYTYCTPEPATIVMAGLGLLALVGVARKRHIRRDHH